MTEQGFETIKQPYFDAWSLEVWQKAILQSQKDRLLEVGKETVIPFAQQTLRRMYELEITARTPLLDRITKIDVEKMEAIWCLAAPGTFYQAQKDDRYREVPYAKWWDRQQIISAVGIAGIIGRLRAGFRAVEKLDQKELPQAYYNSPIIIYNGRPDENASLRKAVEKGKLPQRFPGSKVQIIDTDQGDRFNLLGQVRNFKMSDDNPPERLGIVIRPAQALRLLLFMNNPNNGFPSGVPVKIFPVRTSKEGIPNHYIQETCGILYYRFTTGDAAEVPYPYEY